MSLPWYKWFPSDWLASETRFGMTLAERGAYRDLLDIHYTEGSIPANQNVLAGLLGVSREEFGQVWPAVSAKFQPHPDDPSRLVNEKALLVLADLEEFRAKQTEKARLGARARWKRCPEHARGHNPACPEYAHAEAYADKNYVRSDERTARAVSPDAETVTPGSGAQADASAQGPGSPVSPSSNSCAASGQPPSPDPLPAPGTPSPNSARPPSPAAGRQQYPAWFEEFWSEYPASKGVKAKARAAALKHVPAEARPGLVPGLRRRLAHMRALEAAKKQGLLPKDFLIPHMKHAERYFSHGVWDQDPEDDLGPLPAGTVPGDSSLPMLSVEERDRGNEEMRRLMAEQQKLEVVH